MNPINTLSPSPMSLRATPATVENGASQTTTKMAQEFEGLILSQLLKQMRSRSGSDEGGLFPGDKSDTYGGMFDMYFGQFLAENGGLGLAEYLGASGRELSPTDSSQKTS